MIGRNVVGMSRLVAALALSSFVLSGFVACGSDDGAGANGKFEDESGRSCSVSGEEISCSGEGATCTPPATSVFFLERLLMSPMRVCAGCKGSDGATSYDTDSCEQVPCQASSDCGFPKAECKQGYCWCSPGTC